MQKYLLITVTFFLIPFIMWGYDIEIDGIYYNVHTSNKTVSVTFGDEKYEGSIVIPPSIDYANQTLPVSFIGGSAFEGCKSLMSVDIPNSVTRIGVDAFYNCSSLVSVDIPNSVTEIGGAAFAGCSSLVSMHIPNSVTLIGWSAFQRCSSLVSVDIPNSVTEIGGSAFKGCKNLMSVDIPNSVTEIGGSAFEGCSSLVSVDIPNSVTEIGVSTFEGCSSLVSVDIPNSVTTLGESSFLGCENLKKLVIPGSVISIGYMSFKGCFNLEEVILEDSDVPIDFKIGGNGSWGYYYVFNDCPLREIYLGRNIGIDLLNSWKSDYSPFYDNVDIEIFSIGSTVTLCLSLCFDRFENLQIINCYSLTPPRIPNASTYQYTHLTVNIPQGSLNTYQKNSYWINFWNLQETLPGPEIKPEQIILNIESSELNIGETLQLEATVLPEDTTDKSVVWSSSDEMVVAVSETGLVSTVSVGSATITATCGEVSAECAITVLDDSGIESLLANPDSKITIYTTDGILIKKNCKVEDLKTLNKGIYIIVSGKEHYKISI